MLVSGGPGPLRVLGDRGDDEEGRGGADAVQEDDYSIEGRAHVALAARIDRIATSKRRTTSIPATTAPRSGTASICSSTSRSGSKRSASARAR